MEGGRGQASPAVSALFRHWPTVLGDIWSDLAIWRLLRPLSCASLRISLVFLIDNLLADTILSFLSKEDSSAQGGYPAIAAPICPEPFAGNKCPPWTGIGVQFAPESPSSFHRNRCPVCTGAVIKREGLVANQ